MIIACDFDGTIVRNAYPAIGKAIPFAIETLKRLQEDDHHQVILWTCREGQELADAVDYCKSQGLEFYAVNSNFVGEDPSYRGVAARKIQADLFIDDRNLGGLPDWGQIYQAIRSGHPYNPSALISDPDLDYKRKHRHKKSIIDSIIDYFM